MHYKVTQKFLDALKEERFELSGLSKREFFQETYECLIGINKDWTVSIVIDKDTLESNPDYFIKVEE